MPLMEFAGDYSWGYDPCPHLRRRERLWWPSSLCDLLVLPPYQRHYYVASVTASLHLKCDENSITEDLTITFPRPCATSDSPINLQVRR